MLPDFWLGFGGSLYLDARLEAWKALVNVIGQDTLASDASCKDGEGRGGGHVLVPLLYILDKVPRKEMQVSLVQRAPQEPKNPFTLRKPENINSTIFTLSKILGHKRAKASK